MTIRPLLTYCIDNFDFVRVLVESYHVAIDVDVKFILHREIVHAR